MVELSKKRIEEILNEETAKTEELPTILAVFIQDICACLRNTLQT